MKQIMMNKNKAKAFGRTCQCTKCKHAKCGNEIECLTEDSDKVLYLCHCCGVNYERDGFEVYEIVF